NGLPDGAAAASTFSSTSTTTWRDTPSKTPKRSRIYSARRFCRSQVAGRPGFEPGERIKSPLKRLAGARIRPLCHLPAEAVASLPCFHASIRRCAMGSVRSGVDRLDERGPRGDAGEHPREFARNRRLLAVARARARTP